MVQVDDGDKANDRWREIGKECGEALHTVTRVRINSLSLPANTHTQISKSGRRLPNRRTVQTLTLFLLVCCCCCWMSGLKRFSSCSTPQASKPHCSTTILRLCASVYFPALNKFPVPAKNTKRKSKSAAVCSLSRLA